MVDNLFKSIVLNCNIINNINYYENLRLILQKECDHLPVLLGESSTSTVLEDGIEVPKKYKRCLLCGAYINFDKTSNLEIDASAFLEQEDQNKTWDEKYLKILNLFHDICYQASSEEEAILKLQEQVNTKNNLKIRKKTRK